MSRTFINIGGSILVSPGEAPVFKRLKPGIYYPDVSPTPALLIDTGKVCFASKDDLEYDWDLINEVRDRYKRGLSCNCLFHGKTGTGKSVTAERIANSLSEEHKLPIIQVNDKVPAGFLSSLVSMFAPCVVYLDEFTVSYDKDDQDKLLSLFTNRAVEGVIYICTTNNHEDVNPKFKSRPERFWFCVEFEDLNFNDIYRVLEEKTGQPENTLIALSTWLSHTRASWDIVNMVADVVGKNKIDPDTALDRFKHINIDNVVVPMIEVDVSGGTELMEVTGVYLEPMVYSVRIVRPRDGVELFNKIIGDPIRIKHARGTYLTVGGYEDITEGVTLKWLYGPRTGLRTARSTFSRTFYPVMKKEVSKEVADGKDEVAISADNGAVVPDNVGRGLSTDAIREQAERMTAESRGYQSPIHQMTPLYGGIPRNNSGK